LRPAAVSRGVSRIAVAGMAVAAFLGISVSDARAAGAQACDASAYTLALQSLNGPAGTDLTIRIGTARPDCAPPDTLSDVQAAVSAYKGHPGGRLEFSNVPSPVGEASVHLGRLVRRQRVAATVTLGSQIVLNGKAVTLLRPDLVLERARAPKQTLTGRAFSVRLTIRQRTPDLRASALATVTSGGAVLASIPFKIAPRTRLRLDVPVTLPTAGRTPLDVSIVASDPAETTTANNTKHATLDVTDFQVLPSAVLVQSLAGYGAQFNNHVYAAISRNAGVTEDNLKIMEQAVRALHPQFSRIFFNPSELTDPDRMQSFVRTVLLAQTVGTWINITWQGGRLDTASGTIQKFANVLVDLIKNRGVTRLRWLTLQNEPNSTKLTPAQVETEYRQLDPYIQNIRGQLHYMGGDLVRTNQQAWFDYMATHMSDILDAYSVHVYWDFWDTQKLQDRLTEVRAIVDALPPTARKPVYVTEYGIRGLRTLNGVPQGDPGVWTDGVPIAQTSVAAFQQAWFDILSARLGYVGTSKWDAYFGRYDNGIQAYYMIGDPAQGWPLFPLYNFMHLMTTTVKRGWKVIGVDEVAGTTALLSAYESPADQETVVGLDTAGSQLNTASTTQVTYVIGGLPASQNFRLAIWNQAGDGLDGPTTTVKTDAAGVATIVVPQTGVFVLTTLRLA
jgi:Glycosyl hydrolase catalytic core